MPFFDYAKSFTTELQQKVGPVEPAGTEAALYSDEDMAFYVKRMWAEGLTPTAASRLWSVPSSRSSFGPGLPPQSQPKNQSCKTQTGVRVAERVGEAVVGGEPAEQLGGADATAHPAAHAGGVVEDDPGGHAADVLEYLLEGLAHALGVLAGEHLGEVLVDGVARYAVYLCDIRDAEPVAALLAYRIDGGHAHLSPEDEAAITAFLDGYPRLQGDCYTLERESPRYKSIIHMNVNEEEQGGNDALAGK